jgi:hypothetical protein
MGSVSRDRSKDINVITDEIYTGNRALSKLNIGIADFGVDPIRNEKKYVNVNQTVWK